MMGGRNAQELTDSINAVMVGVENAQRDGDWRAAENGINLVLTDAEALRRLLAAKHSRPEPCSLIR
jgi:hypothetical protein